MTQPTTRMEAVVVGAGVAGLLAAATLQRTGASVRVLERRASVKDADDGADLALWPCAVKILKALGVRPKFFEHRCYALHTVHMCNADFGERVPMSSVLTTVDMQAVTEGTGECFVLVPRDALMHELRALVADDCVQYGAEVLEVSDDGRVKYSVGGATHEARGVVLGCDGAQSRVRQTCVASDAADARFCGEVVYRGVLDASDVRELLPDGAQSRVMRINYGAGVRSSFGYMSGDGELAYWWVKQPSATPTVDDECTLQWPEPLRELHRRTPVRARYTHAVYQGPSLDSWNRGAVCLVGDAAHLVTPNMGQGACLAIEDAFVVATLLMRDGVRGFEEYARVRKPFAEMCAAEAKKQLVLGQLTSAPLVWLRNFILRNVPPRVLVAKLRANHFEADEYISLYRELCEKAS